MKFAPIEVAQKRPNGRCELWHDWLSGMQLALGGHQKKFRRSRNNGNA
jgi:hypothetical protein